MTKKKLRKNHIILDKWEVEISDQKTIEKVINYAQWCKYRSPQDENERWYNRGIDRVISMIEDYIETF
jgi:hypothetical protein